MSITTLTIQGQTYESYASLDEANAYLNVDPNKRDTWNALDDDAKKSNLVAATRRLDLLNWQGEKTGGATQENEWPRTNVSYPDGTPVSTTEVPKEVENATATLAGTIAIDGEAATQGTSGSNIRRVTAGSATVTFFRRSDGVALQDETAYTLVLDFLEASATSENTGQEAYGTEEESTFTDRDKFGVTRGFP